MNYAGGVPLSWHVLWFLWLFCSALVAGFGWALGALLERKLFERP